MSNSYTLHNIQALRAIAAIMVVMHHAFPHYEAMGTTLPFIQHISNWGFVGVDIFFIISGFIMAYTTFNKPRGLESAKRFIKHRLFRIYLGYLPFLFAMSILLYVIDPVKLKSLDILGSFFLVNSDMFQLVLPASWSLTFELYFYLLFLVTFFFTRKQIFIYVPLFIILLTLIVLASSYKSILPLSFFYSPFLLEFFLGIILYMYRDYLMHTWILILAITVLILSFNYGVTHESKNGLIRILTFGTSAFSFVLVALIIEYKDIYKSHPLLEDIGNASYTLYLSHYIILQLFYLSGFRNLFKSHNQLFPFIGLWSIIFICILFSMIYYRYIEKPLYHRIISL